MNNIYGEPGNIPRVAKVIMAVSHPIRDRMICLIGAGDIREPLIKRFGILAGISDA